MSALSDTIDRQIEEIERLRVQRDVLRKALDLITLRSGETSICDIARKALRAADSAAEGRK